MDFKHSARSIEYQDRMRQFMDEVVCPNEAQYEREVRVIADATERPVSPVMEEMKAEAKRRGLWNLFLTNHDLGAGLTNVEYAPVAEITGRSWAAAPEATNCAAPDSGNMEILALFGTPEQQKRWLEPLLNGEIRSAFAMTEPAVASSDASNIQASIFRDGHEYVLNGRKWLASGLLDPRCKVVVFMGKTDPSADPYRQQSMILVPIDAPGLEIEHDLTVFGYTHAQGHPVVSFTDVRVPVENLLGEEGSGFAISQARLGPGRTHQCMRALGMAEYALDLLIDRAESRTPFGIPLADQGVIQQWIAEARIEIEQARLLVLKTCWLLDTVGNKAARSEISAIKAIVPRAALKVIDRAIQVHGGAGVTDEFPLARMYTFMRTVRIGDGPDEVHLRSVARQEIRRRQSARRN